MSAAFWGETPGLGVGALVLRTWKTDGPVSRGSELAVVIADDGNRWTLFTSEGEMWRRTKKAPIRVSGHACELLVPAPGTKGAP